MAQFELVVVVAEGGHLPDGQVVVADHVLVDDGRVKRVVLLCTEPGQPRRSTVTKKQTAVERLHTMRETLI